MIKDKSIVDLIETLKLKTPFNKLEIIDFWDGDLCAIGIKRNNKMVYINAFEFSEGREDGYDFDLEMLDPVRIDNLHVVKEGRGVDEATLIMELRSFLEV